MSTLLRGSRRTRLSAVMVVGDPGELFRSLLAGRAALADVRAWASDPEVCAFYRRPVGDRLEKAWLSRHSDWLDRSARLTETVDAMLDEATELADVQPSRAGTIARAVLLTIPLLPDPWRVAATAADAGQVLFSIDADFDAANAFAEALTALRSVGDHRVAVEAELQARLVVALYHAGHWDEIREQVQLLSERAGEAGLRGLTALALRVKGQVAARDGRPDDAMQWLSSAVALRRSLSAEEEMDPRQRVAPLEEYLQVLGHEAGRLGRVGDAEGALREVAERLEQAGSDRAYMAVQDLGITYHLMGDDVRAADELERAASIADRMGLKDEAIALSKQATRHRRLAQETEPKRHDDLAAMSVHADDAPITDAAAANHLNDQVIDLLQTRQWTHVRSLAERVLAWARRNDDVGLELSVRNSLGVASNELRDFDGARTHFLAGMRLADSRRQYGVGIRLRMGLAKAYANKGDPESAFTVLDSAIQLTPFVWHAAETSYHRQEILAGLADLFDRYAFLTAGSGEYLSYLSATELVRSRNATQWLVAEQRLEAGDLDSATRIAARSALRGLRAVDVELELLNLSRKLTAARARELDEERDRLLDRLEELTSALAPRSLRDEFSNYSLT
jgi:tetratricopeptide (TPR) repeat protein